MAKCFTDARPLPRGRGSASGFRTAIAREGLSINAQVISSRRLSGDRDRLVPLAPAVQEHETGIGDHQDSRHKGPFQGAHGSGPQRPAELEYTERETKYSSRMRGMRVTRNVPAGAPKMTMGAAASQSPKMACGMSPIRMCNPVPTMEATAVAHTAVGTATFRSQRNRSTST